MLGGTQAAKRIIQWSISDKRELKSVINYHQIEIYNGYEYIGVRKLVNKMRIKGGKQLT